MLVSDLLPNGEFLGASLISTRLRVFVWHPPALKNPSRRRLLTYRYRGGESSLRSYLSEGVLREACEEIAADVTLIPCPRTP